MLLIHQRGRLRGASLLNRALRTGSIYLPLLSALSLLMAMFPPQASALPPLALPLEVGDSIPPPYEGAFSIEEDSTLVILGGSNAVEASRHAYLDTLLSAAHPNSLIRIRNIGWQADTVFQQKRPRHFYEAGPNRDGQVDGRQRIRPDVIFLWMGKSESLEGIANLPAFHTAYQEIAQALKTYTGRVVLITPPPFDNPLDLPFDLEERNNNLAAYVETIEQIGEEEGLLVVDLFHPLLEQEGEQIPYTRDGIQLNAQGHWIAATQIALQLGFANPVEGIQLQSTSDALLPAKAESLRQLAMHRNELWFRYWRPTNWAFLYGNRQTQPSSRDHRNRRIRWFPEEVESTLSLIETEEQAIHQAAAGVFD